MDRLKFQERKIGMKKLVLIEDAPWRAEKSLIRLQKANVEIAKIFYYESALIMENKELLDMLQQKLKAMVETINAFDFFEKVNEYYKRDDIFILMDLNLGDEIGGFDNRINVQYAKSKENKGKGKIAFYTTGGKDLKSMLERNFSNQLVDVLDFQENQLYWDEDQVINFLNN